MLRAVLLVTVAATVAATVVVTVCGACGSGRRPQMYPAGTDRDDGYGDLAQKSARLLTSDKPDASLFAHHARRRHGDPYGGDPYGGAMYGGDAGGAPPATARAGAARATRYNVIAGLTGAIEGTVTWRTAPPAALVTACGSIASPSVRVGAGRAVADVLVYIEHVDVGRPLPSYGRAITVGGTIAKRGCALAPLAQIVTPLPAGLAIHGDATEARLRVTSPAGTRPFELQAAGRVALEVQPGVTRVEADDGSLAAAWVVATDTPYYAITDDRGHFRIDELAAGTYDVTFWHPPLATLTDGKLVYGPPVVVHRTVRVDAIRPARLDVALER
jgi:hypothetical protein